MAPGTKRQNEIMDAALRIIAARGIRGLTVKNIARLLGVTEPALYRHFRSKYHLMASIIARYRDHLAGLFDAKPDGGGASFGRITAFYRDMFEGFAARPALSEVLFSEELFRHDRKLSKEVAGIIDTVHDHVTCILRDGARRGEIRTDIPAKQLSWMVMGAMRILVARWRISGYGIDLQREGRSLLGDIHRAIRA